MRINSYFQSYLSAWLGILLFCFTFTASGQKKTLDHPAADKNLKTAKATVEAYEAQDWEKLRGFFNDDARIFGLASFDSLNLNETISYWTKGGEAASPDLSEESYLAVSYKEGPRKGNWVYHWGKNTLTFTSGTKISFPYHLALKIKDNKVEQAHFYYDNNKIIREMGYAISPPLEEEDSVEVGTEVNLEGPTGKN